MRTFIIFFVLLFSVNCYSQLDKSVNKRRVILFGEPVAKTPSPLIQINSLSLLSTSSLTDLGTFYVTQNFSDNLGDTSFGEPISRTIYFYSDTRTTTQPMGQISISGSPYFSIVNNNCLGQDIAGGATCTIEVQYLASIPGTHQATVSINWTNVIVDSENGYTSSTVGDSHFHFTASTNQENLNEIDTEHSCQLAANSSINVDTLSLDEYVDLVGVDFKLNYSSNRMRIGSKYNPSQMGLGGWSASNVHFYNPAQAILHLGNGGLRNVLAEVVGNEYIVSSKDGRLIYEFDIFGKHIRTRHAKTNVILRQFDYDTTYRLISQVDQFGKSTLIQHLADRAEIISPYGQTTKLEYNNFGYLVSITNPNNESYSMEYDNIGLLLKFKKPMGQESTVNYDISGKVILDVGAGGDLIRLVRDFNASTDTQLITKSTALGIQTFYETSSSNGASTHNVYGSHGESFSYSYEREGTNTFSNNYGESSESQQEPNPQFSWMSPYTKEYSFSIANSPIAITKSIVKSATGLNTSDPRVFSTIKTTTQEQGDSNRTYIDTYEASSNVSTRISPENRKVTVQYNDRGLVSSYHLKGIHPVYLQYDENGHLVEIKQGNRKIKNTYDDYGNLKVFKNAIGKKTYYKYDSANRLILETSRRRKSINYEYDENGNLTAIKPPGRKAHRFDFNQMELISQYLPPALRNQVNTETQYIYNLDRQLTAVRQADGSTIEYNYNQVSGLLESIDTPRGQYIYTFPGFSKQLQSLTSPDGVTINYNRSGSLLKSLDTIGEVNSGVYFAYRPDALVEKITVGDGTNYPSLYFGYDRDSLINQAGSMTINRGVFGEVRQTNIGVVDGSHEYNDYGEVIKDSYSENNENLYAIVYKRDKVGRITSVSESSQNQKREKKSKYSKLFKQFFHKQKHHRSCIPSNRKTTFLYDSLDRLNKVIENDRMVRKYKYDANGNRIAKWSKGKLTLSRYDSQDRLVRSGNTRYGYNLRGDLMKKMVHNKITLFDYDVFGNLKSVILSNDKKIDYLVDGQNRRIGKKVNGQLQQAFIYQSQTQVAAELDSNNTIIKRFVYGEKINIPDYMIYQNKNYRIISDHVGTPKMIVDTTSGDIVASFDFDEFGVLLKKTGSIDIPFGFAGGLYDHETGLTRFGARDYDASVGRWLSKDPILFAGGDTNLYGYVLNDPVNFIDPDGQRKTRGQITAEMDMLMDFINCGILERTVSCELMLDRELEGDVTGRVLKDENGDFIIKRNRSCNPLVSTCNRPDDPTEFNDTKDDLKTCGE